MRQRLGGQLWRDILVEEGNGIVAPVLHPLAISRMGPVAVGRLSGRGDHRRDRDEQFHSHPVADERGASRSDLGDERESAFGMPGSRAE
jgi:hypothetical protein